MAHLLEAPAEKLFHLLMPVLKFAQHPAQQPGNALVRQSHDARDDSPRYVFGGGMKRAHQHPRAVWRQGRPNAFRMDGWPYACGHGFISAWCPIRSLLFMPVARVGPHYS